jgi:hypothetical protein
VLKRVDQIGGWLVTIVDACCGVSAYPRQTRSRKVFEMISLCWRSHTLLGFLVAVVSFPPVIEAQETYGKGWTAPLDGIDLDTVANNFGLEYPAYPFSGKWHCGWDVLAAQYSEVRAVADGQIVLCSPGGWDLWESSKCNYAIVIRVPATGDAAAYVGLGHLLRPKDAKGKPLSDEAIRHFRIGETVRAGEIIGQLGAYGDKPHLHMFVYFDPTNADAPPSGGYGRQPLPRPNSSLYAGVLSFGSWRDPRGWMRHVEAGGTAVAEQPHPISILSDTSWRSSPRLEQGWTAAGFDDSSWNHAGVTPTPPVTAIYGLEDSTATPVWDPQSTVKSTCYMRKRFGLPAAPVVAQCTLSADDEYELFVNGKRIGGDGGWWAWRRAETYDITKSLNAGDNVIAVRCTDVQEGRWLLASIRIEFGHR